MTDFGGKLRQARERRGISLRQIAANTKISTAALEALERNDISRLPGGIFSRAFVRSYATEVGLDPDETVREFLARFEAEPPPTVEQLVVPEEESDFESRQRMAGVVLTLVVVSLVVVAAIAYVMMRRPAPQEGESPSQSAAGMDDNGPGVAEPAAARPAPPPLEPAASPSPSPATARPAAQGFRLELHPSGPCWISLSVDGERLLARVVAAGERLTYEVRRQAVIDVGDAGVFEYTLNGRPGRSLGGAGQVRTARISPDTLDDYVR
jgi:cytoskeleton protein RodZ